MRLVLIRHGQTPSNVLGLLDTAPPGPGLSDLGLEQAARVPDELAGERSVDAIFASTAVRAQLTAAPLAQQRGPTVQIRAGLREIAAGDWEMAGDQASVQGYLTTIGAWIGGDLELRTPGAQGESGVEVLARFDEVVAEFGPAHYGTVVAFAHGAVIRFWASVRSVNLPVGFGADHPLSNTGIVILVGDPAAGWNCLSWTGAPIVDVAGDTEQGPAAEDIPVVDHFAARLPTPTPKD